jgi:peptidoglycan/xylan/chitin deacetylase (PgdA/CDA1 family)
MTHAIITTSWDDGHVLDLKLADLLQKYGLKGTFYIAPEDREFTPTDRLTPNQIHALAQNFEVGAHTVTHPRLTQVPDAEAEREIRESKSLLETITGRPVTSFCYPAGAYSSGHVQMVKNAGFAYARTVERFKFALGSQPLTTPTSIHAYRHWSDLGRIAGFAHANPWLTLRYLLNWDLLAIAMFERTLRRGGVFHIWGHSWEIDRNGDWSRLERVFKHISGHPSMRYVTNGELA